jgi:hypothetical protein
VFNTRDAFGNLQPPCFAVQTGFAEITLGELSSVVWLYSDWTSGSLRRTSRIISECAVSRGGSGTAIIPVAESQPIARDKSWTIAFAQRLSGTDFTNIRDAPNYFDESRLLVLKGASGYFPTTGTVGIASAV